MELRDEVVSRLKDLGYNETGGFDTVEFMINLATQEILNNINCSFVPNGLRYVLVDMAVGYFLKEKKATGALSENFDFSAPVKSITEGDIAVAFASKSDGSSTPESRFDEMIQSLINPDKKVFAKFRRLEW